MRITVLSTTPLLPPRDDLFVRLDAALTHVPERAVVAVSSKVVAIGEGRCVPIPDDVDVHTFKDAHIVREADRYLPRTEGAPGGRFFTIKDGVLIGSAGIDQSNGNGHLVLWPTDAMQSAHEIRARIMARFGLQELGVVVTDSTSTPLRNGATGFALGYAGFRALFDYRGQPDIFGRLIRVERLNVADSLATAATFAMGEGGECTPFALIEDIPHIVFAETEASDPHLALTVPLTDDLFAPFFKDAPWEEGSAA